jgi:hypothetical protein
MQFEPEFFHQRIDDIEQQSYLQGWMESRRQAKTQEIIVGSWWFAVLCFMLGLVCGMFL